MLDPAHDYREAVQIAWTLSGTPRGGALVFDFVKENFDALVARAPRDAAASFPRWAGSFCSEAGRAEVEEFFRERAPRYTGGPRILAQTLERITPVRRLQGAAAGQSFRLPEETMSDDCIDIHTHIVPENFPAYAGKGRDVPWPSMAEAHACHKHVMISGKVYRTVADGSWSVPRRIEAMGEMRVARQALSPMPELLSYWLPLEDAQGADPLPERADRGDDRARAGALRRPGRGAAAGRRQRHPRTGFRHEEAEILRRRDRQPRQRRLDRRRALRAVLRRGREAWARRSSCTRCARPGRTASSARSPSRRCAFPATSRSPPPR